LEETDAENFFQLYKETTSSPYLLEENEYSELYRKTCWTEATTPSTFNAMLFLKDSNDFVGRICMQFIDSPLPELGIDILKIHQNKGFGPEAIIGFCNWFYKKNIPDGFKNRKVLALNIDNEDLVILIEGQIFADGTEGWQTEGKYIIHPS
jgi:hypothetical protein